MKNNALLYPFDADLCFDFDIREMSVMKEEDAKYLLAQLTVARLQTAQYLNNFETKQEQEFVLDTPF